MYSKIAVLTALLLLVGAQRVSACSCASEELDKAVLHADYILVGTVLSRQDTPPDSRGISSGADPVYFGVVVERMLKGVRPSPALVVTNQMSASCGYPFEQGARYLIFGYRAEGTLPGHTQQKGVIRTNLCTLTTAEHVDSLATQAEALLTGRPVSPTDASNILPQREVCGGIAGIACPQGYECEYPEPNYPDAQGVCKKIKESPPSSPEIPISETGSERYTVEEGFDRPGADYENFEQTSSFQSPSLCRDACFSQPQCRSFNYTKPGVAGPQARCWLKNAVPPPVENLCCISGVKGARPSQPAVRKTRLAWQGWDTDQVGHQTTDGQPDGRPDQHFRLSLVLPVPQEIIAITLHPADDQGIPTDTHHWSSKDSAFSILGVVADGKRLNPSHTPSLGQFSGAVVFDLFANDTGIWKKGGFALVEVSLANGQKLGHWTRLEPPEGRLIGQWNILCQSSSPQAFEPQTLSGSFYMDIEPDGCITGIFGSQKLSGSIDKAGAASGTAGVEEEAVTWTGTITRSSRKQSLKGRGGFKFQRVNHQCFSDGQWWSE